MNRIEFMTELAALLQDVSVEERREAMQYYNDYFDDAGADNEQQVMSELESPAKVAATIRADFKNPANAGEYTETGYTDQRFETKEPPADTTSSYRYEGDQGEKVKTNRGLKIALIIAIILIGGPILIPLAIGIAAIVFGCIVAVFSIFIVLVIVAVCIVITGISLFCVGIVNLVPELAVGIALIGTGLVVTVIGVIATVASVRLCMIVFPGICRGIVWICRRPFEGRTVA